MKYISAEEFRKQPKEVQEIFIKWFLKNKSITDLVQIELHPESEIRLYSLRLQESKLNFENNKLIKFKDNKIIVKYEITPLLTENSLRKFLAEKTMCELNVGNITKIIDVYRKELDIPYETDLLQAYWKIAIEIAKEEK